MNDDLTPHNAFENSEQPPLFERMQRELEQEDVDAAVENVLTDMPPEPEQVDGIRRNIERLKADGNWATARFYETLLAKRDRQEG